MWVVTEDGFFSAVKDKYDERQQRMIVRARDTRSLELLLQRIGDADGEIDSHSGTDYKHRVWIDNEQWVKYLVDVGESIDYPNFKSAVGRFWGDDFGDTPYGRAVIQERKDSLMLVWSVLYDGWPDANPHKDLKMAEARSHRGLAKAKAEKQRQAEMEGSK
jgi:hypothetical protein